MQKMMICQVFGRIPQIRAAAGQRSAPDLCLATKFVKIYDS